MLFLNFDEKIDPVDSYLYCKIFHALSIDLLRSSFLLPSLELYITFIIYLCYMHVCKWKQFLLADDGTADDLGFNMKPEGILIIIICKYAVVEIFIKMLTYILFNNVLGRISPAPQKPVVREEPEKIRKWREDQKQRLEEKGMYFKLIYCNFLFICWDLPNNFEQNLI